jgi:hypothetical protein
MPTPIVPKTPAEYPTHRLLAVLDTDLTADAARIELEQLGVTDGLWVLDAQGARRALDSEGKQPGLWHTLTRLVQSLGYEADQLAQYEALADAGAWVLAVDLSSDPEKKDAVVSALKRNQAHTIRYFGPLSIENLGDTRSAT